MKIIDKVRRINEAKDVFFFEDSVESLSNAIEEGISCCGIVHKFNKMK